MGSKERSKEPQPKGRRRVWFLSGDSEASALSRHLCDINLFLKSGVWILVDFSRKRKEIAYKATLRFLEDAVHTPRFEWVITHMPLAFLLEQGVREPPTKFTTE